MRKRKIRVFEPVKQPDGSFLHQLTDVRDAAAGHLSDVWGVGATPNEAARNAFQHAADLMFPPSTE